MQNVGNAIGVAVTGVIFFGALHAGYAQAFELAVAQLAVAARGGGGADPAAPARAGGLRRAIRGELAGDVLRAGQVDLGHVERPGRPVLKGHLEHAGDPPLLDPGGAHRAPRAAAMSSSVGLGLNAPRLALHSLRASSDTDRWAISPFLSGEAPSVRPTPRARRSTPPSAPEYPRGRGCRHDRSNRAARFDERCGERAGEVGIQPSTPWSRPESFRPAHRHHQPGAARAPCIACQSTRLRAILPCCASHWCTTCHGP